MTREATKAGLFPERASTEVRKGEEIVPVGNTMPVAFDAEQAAAAFFPATDNLDAMSEAPQLQAITISKDMASFVLPGEIAEKVLYVVIPAITGSRGFWPPETWREADPELTGTKIPHCYSNDGIAPEPGCHCYSKECETCRFNNWGSLKLLNQEVTSNAKACKDTRSLAVYLLGTSYTDSIKVDFTEVFNDTFPYRISIPPSSIKFVNSYLSSLLTGKPRLSYTVAITKLSLTKVTGQKFTYCTVGFENVGTVASCFQSMDMIQQYKDKTGEFLNILRRIKLQQSDVVDETGEAF